MDLVADTLVPRGWGLHTAVRGGATISFVMSTEWVLPAPEYAGGDSAPDFSPAMQHFFGFTMFTDVDSAPAEGLWPSTSALAVERGVSRAAVSQNCIVGPSAGALVEALTPQKPRLSARCGFGADFEMSKKRLGGVSAGRTWVPSRFNAIAMRGRKAAGAFAGRAAYDHEAVDASECTASTR
jgi:hypothetical protein